MSNLAALGFLEWSNLALALAVLGVVLSVLIIRKSEPSGAIIGRWSLWVCASAGMAILLNKSGISSKPMWATCLFCLLLWALFETLFNWLAIDAVSRSGLPLFPKYKRIEKDTVWPVDKSFLKLRDLLRESGFSPIAAAVGKVDERDYLRCNFFENESADTRLELMFIPRSSGKMSVFFSFSTLMENKQRIITDNVYIPFGGFYPDNFLLERHPLISNFSKLLSIHSKRVKDYKGATLRWETDVLEDVNIQQSVTEHLNIELGFLTDPKERDNYGSISRAGRYHIWTEMWTLNYLGKSKHYY